jgi:hypothetical protein
VIGWFYWRDVKARLGIWLKTCGCRLIHGKHPVTGKTHHPWGAWRAWPGRAEEIRACASCGTYDHRAVPSTGTQQTEQQRR